MITLNDLIKTVTNKGVIDAVERIYGESENGRRTKYEGALDLIRTLEPITHYPAMITIDYCASPDSDGEYPYSNRTYDTEEGSFIISVIEMINNDNPSGPAEFFAALEEDLTGRKWRDCGIHPCAWEDTLGLLVDLENLKKMTKEDFVAHMLYHMTGCGYSLKEREQHIREEQQWERQHSAF